MKKAFISILLTLVWVIQVQAQVNTPTMTPIPSNTPSSSCCQLSPSWESPFFSSSGDASGVAVDTSRGRVYVPDENADTLMVVDYTGAPVTAFPVEDAFSVAVGACAYDGVYVAARNEGTVSKNECFVLSECIP